MVVPVVTSAQQRPCGPNAMNSVGVAPIKLDGWLVLGAANLQNPIVSELATPAMTTQQLINHALHLHMAQSLLPQAASMPLPAPIAPTTPLAAGFPTSTTPLAEPATLPMVTQPASLIPPNLSIPCSLTATSETLLKPRKSTPVPSYSALQASETPIASQLASTPIVTISQPEHVVPVVDAQGTPTSEMHVCVALGGGAVVG